jgi:DNA-binding transcriptional LysR family regulator
MALPPLETIAAAARVLYDGRDGALRQQITKIETAAGFTIIDRSSTPLTPTAAGGEFIREALQILRSAHRNPAPPGNG